MSCGMKMYWNWETKIPYIFFEWWTAMTPASLALSIILVFSLAFCYEMVINLRARYDGKIIAEQRADDLIDEPVKSTGKCCSSTVKAPGAINRTASSTSNCCNCPTLNNAPRPFTLKQSLIRSGLFAFSNFYSLFLMMIFMTYNAYLCIALVMGAGCGHLWSSVFIPEVDPLNRPRSCCN